MILFNKVVAICSSVVSSCSKLLMVVMLVLCVVLMLGLFCMGADLLHVGGSKLLLLVGLSLH